MGCDSHVYVEVKSRNGGWRLHDDEGRYWDLMAKEDLSYEQMDEIKPKYLNYLGSRNYLLFALLADVRNHDGAVVEPLFPRRGVPDNVSASAKKNLECCDYHSHTYFTLAELMVADLDKVARFTLTTLFANQFLSWNETGEGPDDLGDQTYIDLIRGRSQDPFHRQVTPEEMTLLLLSHTPKELIKKIACGYNKRNKVNSGPYIITEVPRTYHQCAPELRNLVVPALKTLGPPNGVRVLIAFDN